MSNSGCKMCDSKVKVIYGDGWIGQKCLDEDCGYIEGETWDDHENYQDYGEIYE